MVTISCSFILMSLYGDGFAGFTCFQYNRITSLMVSVEIEELIIKKSNTISGPLYMLILLRMKASYIYDPYLGLLEMSNLMKQETNFKHICFVIRYVQYILVGARLLKLTFCFGRAYYKNS